MTVMTFTAPATADVVMPNPPTTTVESGAGSALSGATQVKPNDARYRYLGAGGMGYGARYPDTILYMPSSRYDYTYGSPQSYGIEFSHTGTEFETVWKYLNQYTSYRLWIDGVRVSILPQGGITGIAVGYSFKLTTTFSARATRTIRVDTGYMPFRGTFIASGDTLAAP